jgi:hypothetical protein
MKTISEIDLTKLSLSSLCEIYAASFGICMGYTEAGKGNLIRSIEFQKTQGKIVMPSNPSKKLLNEIA